jgi:TRAP-type mannitol/chloroaromatic compound transport system permease large subunit
MRFVGVFTYSGGDTMVEEFIHNLPAKEMSFILISMGIILILGFFIDFVEISLIIVPIFCDCMKYSHSKAMAVFHKIVELVKNGVLMIIHIYAKVSLSLKPIKTIPLWEYNEAD